MPVPGKPQQPLSFQPASSLEDTVKIKALLLGPAGSGKTSVAVLTAPRPVGVILCENDSALDYPRVHMREVEGLSDKEIDKNLKLLRVNSWDTMMQALAASRAAADSGEINTLVVDPFNFWCDNLMDQCFKWTLTGDGKEDGRRAHPEATKRIRQVVFQLLGVSCHTIVVSHYMDVGEANKRGGPDKVPMLPNKEARVVVHGMFPHKLWMEFRNGERVFITTPQGFTGPGIRGFRGAKMIPAHMGTLMRALHLPGAPKDAPDAPEVDAEEEEEESEETKETAATTPARPSTPPRPAPRPAPPVRSAPPVRPGAPKTSPVVPSRNSSHLNSSRNSHSSHTSRR